MSDITAFKDDRRIAAGDRDTVARDILQQFPDDQNGILVFEDVTGRLTDLDYSGAALPPAPRTRGRPKLGVQAREVTLLPRHWEWLAVQPGGASAALRRLVEEARKGERDPQQRRDAVYRFMQATCGDRAGYEEALRALYRGEADQFAEQIARWPRDIVAYIGRLMAA